MKILVYQSIERMLMKEREVIEMKTMIKQQMISLMLVLSMCVGVMAIATPTKAMCDKYPQVDNACPDNLTAHTLSTNKAKPTKFTIQKKKEDVNAYIKINMPEDGVVYFEYGGDTHNI